MAALSERSNPYTSKNRADRRSPLGSWERVAERNRAVIGQGIENDIDKGIDEVGDRNHR